MPNVVSACVLHICESHEENFDKEWLEVESEMSEHGSATAGAAQPLTTAVATRDTFTTHFAA